MLPHYSSYKVAENFKLLEALHPGRIDVGLGRAPGGFPIATRALQENKRVDIDLYPQQVSDLNDYLHDIDPTKHRFAGLRAFPETETIPELWLLGFRSSIKVFSVCRRSFWSFLSLRIIRIVLGGEFLFWH